MGLPHEGPRPEPKLRLGAAVRSPCQTCVEVDRFGAGSLQRVLDADASRLRRVNPASEGGQTIGYAQRAIVDDVIPPPCGGRWGGGGGARVMDVNKRPAAFPFPDDHSPARGGLVCNPPAPPIPRARTIEEAVAQDDPVQ